MTADNKVSVPGYEGIPPSRSRTPALVERKKIAASLENTPAMGVPFFTPEQSIPAGTALKAANGEIPKLFTPLKIRGVELPNRIWLSPMCQYSAHEGFHTLWHTTHYGGIVQRGPGFSMIEATAVQANGRITPEDSGIWLDAHVDKLKEHVDFAHSQNQLISIQLGHAGRKASTVAPWLPQAIATEDVNGWPNDVVGPSDVPFGQDFPTPRALTLDEIDEVKRDFAAAVKRALHAGFDMIELHFAHGYLKAVGDKAFVSTVGSIKTGTLAEELISGGKDEDDTPLDLVAVGRMFQKNPGLVWAWADELETSIQVAHQIGWGFGGRAAVKKESAKINIPHTVAKAIENSPGSTIQAIFGRNPDNLRAFADKYNVASRYDTLESILDDDKVDVVYIGLASHVHAEAIIAAAKRGKAILSEKPLTTTLADAKASLDAVRDANVFMLEGLMYLCHPFMEKVVEIVKSGELGSIRAINGHYAAQIWDRANPLGKGTIYNLGCYPVSLLHLIVQTAFGPDAIRSRKLQAAGNVSHDGGVAHGRDAALMLRLDNGLLATIQSTDSYGKDTGFVVQGDKAVMTFKTNPWLPVAGDNVLTIETYKTGETREVVVTASEDAFACQVKKVEEAFAAGHKEAKRPAARLSDSLEIMELLIEWEEKILGQAP
ncbi:hypothetical protein BN1723_016317 [Verticillium longisporum]|uniref:Gfo/Idh/MocA-like oxidoreductase N-terminal domain-containing protein n=1 Tax=Verticillium longisporum TaxID=100787 RepID=A0A0G4NBU8_VERLO|nr:hypothetical protein BN1723_016317 [Verticillium longisporum]